jgi:hypothetical protein
VELGDGSRVRECEASAKPVVFPGDGDPESSQKKLRLDQSEALERYVAPELGVGGQIPPRQRVFLSYRM